MIGQIRGVLLQKNPPEILVDVGGICYEILVPMSTLYRLPEIGKELLLHTHFVVREDAQTLYGFFEAKDKSMFRSLIRVNGVGPKMALGILSGMEADEFVRTVRSNDVTAMTAMPGIGRKTAERLIVEMRDRLEEWESSREDEPKVANRKAPNNISREAESALIALGYKPQQAARAIAQVVKDNVAVSDSETLIRLALKSMG